MLVCGYVFCVIDCFYDGEIVLEKVVEVVNVLFGFGCYEILLGDMIGVGMLEMIGCMLDVVLNVVLVEKVVGYYYDIKGWVLDNISVSLDKGF